MAKAKPTGIDRMRANATSTKSESAVAKENQELKKLAQIDIPLSSLRWDEEFQDVFGRTHTLERIQENMAQHGYDDKQPVLVWNNYGVYVLLDGHTRAEAAANLGYDTLPARVLTGITDRDELVRYIWHLQFDRRAIRTAEDLLEWMMSESNYARIFDDDLERIHPEAGSRKERISRVTGWSPATVQRCLTVAQHPEYARQVLDGELTVNAAQELINPKKPAPQADPASETNDYEEHPTPTPGPSSSMPDDQAAEPAEPPRPHTPPEPHEAGAPNTSAATGASEPARPAEPQPSGSEESEDAPDDFPTDFADDDNGGDDVATDDTYGEPDAAPGPASTPQPTDPLGSDEVRQEVLDRVLPPLTEYRVTLLALEDGDTEGFSASEFLEQLITDLHEQFQFISQEERDILTHEVRQ